MCVLNAALKGPLFHGAVEVFAGTNTPQAKRYYLGRTDSRRQNVKRGKPIRGSRG
jgi:hypothetical protein